MTGQLALYIRLALYMIAGVISGVGGLEFNEAAGTITLDLNSLALVISGFVITVATYVWSRFAKVRGGAT